MNKNELDFLEESNKIENEPFTGVAKEDAVKAWEFVKKVDTITLDDVLQAHEIIMLSRNSIGWLDKGNFRKDDVGIYKNMRLIKQMPDPEEVLDLMEDWIDLMNRSVEDLEDDAGVEKREKICQEMHVQYEEAHPFADGNGRTGRLWYNWHRLKYGLPIDVIYAKDRDEYYKWFRQEANEDGRGEV